MIDQMMRAFLEACGSAGPLVLGVEEPDAAGVSWRVFDQPFVVVGRDPAADLFLRNRGISRRHAYLQMIAGRLFCVDLQSRTGTRWGDEPGLFGWVHPDPGVRMGPFRFRPRDEGPGTSTGKAGGVALPLPVSRSFEQADLTEARLEILGPSAGSTSWQVSRALVLIGGSRACKVQLRGGGVAEIHAGLVRTPAGVFAVDLLGPGGILVNGERVRYARLGAHDELSVGTHRLRVHCTPLLGNPAGPSQPAGKSKSIAGPVAPTRSADGPALPARISDVGPGKMPAPLGMIDDPASLMRSMLDEFGQIQMQMADRFQDSLLVVLQSFAGAQREQTDLIREELARIRELTEEQVALRSQVEGRGQVAARPHALQLVSGESHAAISSPSSSPPPVRPPRADQPPRRLTIGGGAERVEPAAERPAVRIDESRSGPPQEVDAADVHARICDRLAEIQSERQGRWQKLMDSLLGKGS